MKNQKLILKRILPTIKANISLANYTTFKIGGPTKYFFEAKSKKEIIKAVLVAKEMKLPFFILGGGSNLLVADEGYNGLVIKVNPEVEPSVHYGARSQKHAPYRNEVSGAGSKVKSPSQNSKVIEAESGVLLNHLMALARKNNLTGFGWAVGIPGTVGGAIYGNAGAFNSSMADILKSVEVLEIINQKNQKSKTCPVAKRSFCYGVKNPRRSRFATLRGRQKYKSKIKKFFNKDCQFKYRDSIFKRNPNLIILSAEIQLKRGKKKEIKKKIKEYLNYRKETQPLGFPSAGSIFKNPSNFSAGELIEKCGLKGKRIGDAKISEKHANFIVNLGKAKAKDVKRLINLAKQKVKKKFGILLEEEIVILSEAKKNDPALYARS